MIQDCRFVWCCRGSACLLLFFLTRSTSLLAAAACFTECPSLPPLLPLPWACCALRPAAASSLLHPLPQKPRCCRLPLAWLLPCRRQHQPAARRERASARTHTYTAPSSAGSGAAAAPAATGSGSPALALPSSGSAASSSSPPRHPSQLGLQRGAPPSCAAPQAAQTARQAWPGRRALAPLRDRRRQQVPSWARPSSSAAAWAHWRLLAPLPS